MIPSRMVTQGREMTMINYRGGSTMWVVGQEKEPGAGLKGRKSPP